MRVRTHTNPFNYFHRMAPVDFSTVFQQYSGELDLEIGFGRGVFLRQYAQLFPNRFIVGVEIRKNMVDILRNRIEKLGLVNTYLIHGNGQIVLEDVIADRSLRNVFIFHPDPWFKKRHHKRRVVQSTLLDVLSRKLVVGGKVYVSTDVMVLWEAMAESFNQHPNFVSLEFDDFWETIYQSHWTDFSMRDGRQVHFGTFQYR